MDTLKSRNNRDFTVLCEAGHDAGTVDACNARGAMGIAAIERDLPALPGAGWNADVIEHDRQKPGCHLLTGSHDDIVLLGIIEGCAFLAPGNQFIGLARHGRDNHGHIMPGVPLTLDVPCHILDAFDRGDGGSAEFHHETGHGNSKVRLQERKASDDIADGREARAALCNRETRESMRRPQCSKLRVSTMDSSAASRVDEAEVEKFNRLASQWWDPRGEMKPLHKFNPVRLAWLRDALALHFDRDPKAIQPFRGLSLLDIGCGGGLLSEPLARMGFAVTGIDPAGNNVEVATAHAARSGVEVTYRKVLAETLLAEKASFDAVLAMEVVEHVPDVPDFVDIAARLARPGGFFGAATINRTKRSFALAIVGAEYVLRWLPVGTHSWDKFVTPDELEAAMTAAGLEIRSQSGVVFNPLTDRWSLANDMAVNYMMSARKMG